MKDTIKVSIYQMDCKADIFEPDFKETNMERVAEYVAAHADCDLILLPDEFYAGYGYGVMNLPDFSNTGRIEVLKELAKEHHVHISGAALSMPKKPMGLKTESRAFLISPEGEVIASQCRQHIQEKETEWVLPGTGLEVFDTPLGKVAFLVNFDTFFPEVLDALVSAGAELIINPMLYIPYAECVKKYNLPVEYIDMPPVVRSIQHAAAVTRNCYVLSASAVGTYAQADDFQCAGRSRVVFPNGIIHELPDANEGSLEVVIDSATLTQSRLAMGRCFAKRETGRDD